MSSVIISLAHLLLLVQFTVQAKLLIYKAVVMSHEYSMHILFSMICEITKSNAVRNDGGAAVFGEDGSVL